MSGIEIIVLVTLGALALLVTFIRGPHPDPRLAAEPLSVTARNVLLPFACFLGASLLSELLPGDLRPPAAIAITAAALVVGMWWYRRHPARAEAGNPIDVTSAPASVEEAVGTTAEWIKALLLIGAIVAAMVVLLMAGIGAFCGCGTQPAL